MPCALLIRALMIRALMIGAVAPAAICLFPTALASAGDTLVGNYVEVRTCQVYTGPCFANGEVGSAGKSAIMTWAIQRGSYGGVDLAGRSAAVVVKASHTLGFGGLDDSARTTAMVVVDRAADRRQQAALQEFVLAQTNLKEGNVVSVRTADIDMQFNVVDLTATVEVGDFAHLETRKARHGDCICSNESAYYPPLIELFQYVPGVAIEGDVTARPLGTRWSVPDSRSAYLGIFQVDTSDTRLASRL